MMMGNVIEEKKFHSSMLQVKQFIEKEGKHLLMYGA
jgi:hypothetical protein